jgi:hypothetical protein
MFPFLDLAATIGGLVIPAAFDFIKKKFIKSENDTPERTMSSLATTKPEVLPEYVKGLADIKEVAIKFFNRDVIGSPSQWVVDLRAAIRPVGVSLAFLTLIGMVANVLLNDPIGTTAYTTAQTDILTGVRATCEIMVSSWFGHRFTIK